MFLLFTGTRHCGREFLSANKRLRRGLMLFMLSDLAYIGLFSKLHTESKKFRIPLSIFFLGTIKYEIAFFQRLEKTALSSRSDLVGPTTPFLDYKSKLATEGIGRGEILKQHSSVTRTTPFYNTVTKKLPVR